MNHVPTAGYDEVWCNLDRSRCSLAWGCVSGRYVRYGSSIVR
jgi:hypothetical protein